MNTMRSSLGKNQQVIMLGIMRTQPEAYGLSILDEVFSRTGEKLSIATVYATLDQLKSLGFVKTRAGAATKERGGRSKIFYELTAPGAAALQASLNQIDALRKGIRWKEILQ
jgi:DNA-binding PadR family transcriptional regulator